MKARFNDKNNEILGISPYASSKRYENPKQVFLFALQEIERNLKTDTLITLVDIGCANGEFLYYVKKWHPNWNLYGYDFMPEFIEAGKKFNGLKGIHLELKNFFTLRKKFDVVCCFGTLPIFPDVKKPLKKLLSLCKKNGLLVADGLFNRFDIDVQITYRDNSKIESKNIWRNDFNQHAQTTIAEFLEPIVGQLEFKAVPFNVDLPYITNNPHANAFTFRDDGGNRRVTNGLNILLNSTLLIVKK